MLRKLLLLLLLITTPVFSQVGDSFDEQEEEIQLGGDIFTDFNEDLESSQMMEDERFYRYGRFFSFSLGIGHTFFDGNRGLAYDDPPPSFSFNIAYFFDFSSAFIMGFEFSKHTFNIPNKTKGYNNVDAVGQVDVSMLRFYWGYRYYFDTANLGTAITWSNPHLVLRMEYWYATNRFIDHTDIADDSGGGLGFGIGFGLEFPIQLKKSYLAVQALVHSVNFHDKFTGKFQPNTAGEAGFDDFAGRGYSLFASYVFNW